MNEDIIFKIGHEELALMVANQVSSSPAFQAAVQRSVDLLSTELQMIPLDMAANLLSTTVGSVKDFGITIYQLGPRIRRVKLSDVKTFVEKARMY